MSSNLLIMFVRNSISRKVKTRLAEELGDDSALDIYIRMLEQLQRTTIDLPFDKAVYYSDFIETSDVFDSDHYDKFLQSGLSRGERMHNAFSHAFDAGYKRVVMVCSDCFEISRSHIIDAFEALRDTDTVLGPSTDGSYYLIGMRKFLPLLFINKVWDGENIFLDTMIDLRNNNISFRLLETLSDMETFERVRKSGRFPESN
jgi:rSAM/selenodomain-associated transferase 1